MPDMHHRRQSMSRSGRIILMALLVLGLGGGLPAHGQDKGDKADKPGKHPDQQVVTKHAIQVKGKKLEYTATAGYLTLKDEQQKPTANIFFIAYTLDGAEAGKRPITFAFNGGPGSSSVWLH